MQTLPHQGLFVPQNARDAFTTKSMPPLTETRKNMTTTTMEPPAPPSLSVLDSEQAEAIDVMQRGGNVFLTGMAGTGKSTTLLDFIGQSFRPVDVCATTGIAALNLQQQFRAKAGIALPAHTIYRWAGIMTGPPAGQSFEDFFGYLRRDMPPSRMNAFRRIAKAEVLVIDEISMLPGRTLDYLDFHFRSIRGNPAAFGGIQLIAVGDFLQLPPVAKDGRYDWAFQCEAWQRGRFQVCHLSTIHRQDERDFVDALNAFRLGRIGQRTADLLAARVVDPARGRFCPKTVVRLMTHNVQVDKWNAYQLGEIDSPEVVFEAEWTGPDHERDYLRKNTITPERLALRVGARVMVTANITSANELLAVNGQCGTVEELAGGEVWVRLDNGRNLMLEPRQWTVDPQNDKSATMSQIPLRPAYALTIHKSQGLTLDKAMLDIRAAREPGQAYVALSRLRTLRGLYLKDWISGVRVSEAAIRFYQQHN
jgi:hypothetical protein